jgi:PAS domain S-box-containing protein
MKMKLKILIVEDLPSDAALIKHEIEKNGIQFTDLIIDTKEDFIKGLQEFKPDIILSDYSLPAFDGMQALVLKKEHAPSIPFILVTGSMNEETAVEIIKAGADDYIIKEHITPIGKAIQTAIKKKESEEELAWEQNLMHSLLANIPDYIYFKDLESRFLRINKALARIFGLANPLEALGKTDSDFFENEHSQQAYNDEQEIIRTGKPIINKEEMETWFDRPPTWVSTTKMPLKDPSGKIIGTFGISRSITEHKHAIEAIKTLSKAIEQSPSLIIITNAEGKIEFVNAKFTSFMQYTLDDVKGKNPRIFNPGNSTQEEFETMWRTIRAGSSWKGEFKNEKKDGTPFYEEAIISPLLDDAGTISNFILIMEDISEKKKILDDLKLAKQKAEESDRLKTAFLHNISHEIRTPMNAIVGFSECLNDPGLISEKRQYFTDIIIKSSNQLLSIITDIINIATIEAGQEKIREKEIDINSICNLIHEQFDSVAKSRNIMLNCTSCLDDDDAIILSDETKLTQIITNLVGNALKFTKQGQVEFGYVVKNDMLEFFTKDTGIGISSDMFEEIFKRFRQLEFTATRHFGGSGLGLAISKAYVELLGGRIWLTSEPGKGSVFYFTIPYKKANAVVSADKQPDNGIQTELKRPLTILIAEDNDSNFMLLEELLSDMNIKNIRAANGIDAVEICKSKHVDLVLMDIKMPIMDGCEATQRIKKIKPDLPVIAQTAYTMPEEKERALLAGCDNYITKPIDKKDLTAMILRYGGSK